MSTNYQLLKSEIANFCKKIDRNPQEITLICVSKEKEWGEVKSLYEEGARDFAESRVQEALPKIAEAPSDISWHFIGPLQTNKVSKIIGSFTLIHSVDRLEIAKKIADCSKQKNRVIDILLQVNISKERTKQGVYKEDASKLVEAILSLESLQLKGLMTIAPHVNDEKVIRPLFADLFSLREKFQKEFSIHLPVLSMGMSDDWKWALQEGATHLRLGRALYNRK